MTDQVEYFALLTEILTMILGLYLFDMPTKASHGWMVFCSVVIVVANVSFVSYVAWKLSVYAKEGIASGMRKMKHQASQRFRHSFAPTEGDTSEVGNIELQMHVSPIYAHPEPTKTHTFKPFNA